MARPLFFVGAVLALASFASSQQILVVSSSGGGQFTDIPPAIAAAQPGDIVLVRAGVYSPFTVDKALRVLGDPGAVVSGVLVGFRVQGIPAGGTAVVRGFTLSGVQDQITLSNNRGVVQIEGITSKSGMRIIGCDQVSLLHCTIDGVPTALRVEDSTVALTECDLTGNPGLTTSPTLDCQRSRLIVAHATITGSTSVRFGLPAPGAALTDSSTTIAGDAATVIAAGSGTGAQSAIVLDGGTLTLDPAVTLTPANGGSAIGGNGSVVMASVPSQTALVAGRVLADTLRAPNAQQAFLVAGLAQSPPVPLPFGDLWVSTAQIVVDRGPVTNGTRAAAVSLPMLAPGTTAALQWAVIGPSGLALSTPAIATLDL